MAEDYRYHVFFSYKRDQQTLEWTRQVFQKLKFWLTQELGVQEAAMFMDETGIDIGSDWPEALKEALKSSRCMVCVWLPTYFQSS